MISAWDAIQFCLVQSEDIPQMSTAQSPCIVLSSKDTLGGFVGKLSSTET